MGNSSGEYPFTREPPRVPRECRLPPNAAHPAGVQPSAFAAFRSAPSSFSAPSAARQSREAAAVESVAPWQQAHMVSDSGE
jgi:hypothetical protein